MRSLKLCCAAVAVFLPAAAASASSITGSDIVAIPAGVQPSRNGALDLRAFTFSGSEVENAAGAFDGDNGNNSLPHSAGRDTSSFAESYLTTAGDLQGFYQLNFGVTTAGLIEIVLFLDLNETGSGEATNTLSVFDVVLNPSTVGGGPDPLGDVTSAEQDAIDHFFMGGTLLAALDPEPAGNLPVNAQGAGFADYAIYTGIDPFALAASDVLLFNISMESLSNGSDEIFFDGSVSGVDVIGVIPEPSTALLLALGLAFLARGRRAPQA